MARERAVLFEENPPIPLDASTCEGFRRRVASGLTGRESGAQG